MENVAQDVQVSGYSLCVPQSGHIVFSPPLQPKMSQKCVIIRRDEKGFGLRVSGDNPVRVESVKPDGAAWKAGVRAGQVIIKVNGTCVLKHNHQPVVDMIKQCQSYVALTLALSDDVLPNSCPTTPSISPPLHPSASSNSSLNQINRSESLKAKETKRNHRKISDPALPSSSSMSSSMSISNSEKLNLLAPSSESLNSDDGANDDEDYCFQAPSHPPPPTPSISNSPTCVPPPLPPRNQRLFTGSKRMEIINELFNTEETHVEYLEVLHDIFYKPIKTEQLLTAEQIQQIFSTHDDLLKIHKAMVKQFRAKRKEYEESIKSQLQYPQKFPEMSDLQVGQMLVNIFEGTLGDALQNAASTFCASQTAGLELLNKMKKDSKFALFLNEAESHERCKRLDLKALLAFCFQRVTKYPLLLDNLLKATERGSKEYELIEQAYQRTKDILHVINEKKRCAENKLRLRNIQKKIVKQENLNLDLTGKILVHEGFLNWRQSKQKCTDVLVVLCTDVMVILNRDGDRFLLKNHPNPPILNVSSLLTRDVATDKTAFYLLSNSENESAFYEFHAATATEKDLWTQKIQEISSNGRKHPNHTQSFSKLIDLKSSTSREDDDDDVKSNNVKEKELNKERRKTISTISPTTEDLMGSEDSKSREKERRTKNEGTITYVTEDDLLIPPNAVEVIAHDRVEEAIRVVTLEERLNKLDNKLTEILKERLHLIQEIIRVNDPNEWNIINDLSQHEETTIASILRVIQEAMSLTSHLKDRKEIKEKTKSGNNQNELESRVIDDDDENSADMYDEDNDSNDVKE
ncbi:rho guanine nucleotide exchange factor 12 isoform X2 [Tetranychus urticae]|uniref:rho guanine nucleotide exchange factor 12 isoform X2 n=1 Tax=Tetranychus urticae TaxID=32264 RepID=UPI00077B9A72|nr:rho guanine nucleotide exchange factor 12 isoform X2 [Tetranychus urticae]